MGQDDDAKHLTKPTEKMLTNHKINFQTSDVNPVQPVGRAEEEKGFREEDLERSSYLTEKVRCRLSAIFILKKAKLLKYNTIRKSQTDMEPKK